MTFTRKKYNKIFAFKRCQGQCTGLKKCNLLLRTSTHLHLEAGWSRVGQINVVTDVTKYNVQEIDCSFTLGYPMWPKVRRYLIDQIYPSLTYQKSKPTSFACSEHTGEVLKDEKSWTLKDRHCIQNDWPSLDIENIYLTVTSSSVYISLSWI